MVYCNFSLFFKSGSPKKSAVSGDGAESSGGGEGKGAGVMKKPPDQPEPPIVVRRAVLMTDEKPTIMLYENLFLHSTIPGLYATTETLP